MDPHSAPAAGWKRRHFLHGAALAGAAAITGARAQVGEAAGDAPAASLVGPAAPALPDMPPLAPPDKQPPDLKVPRAERKLGWAIVGLGKLAVEEILPAFAQCERSYVSALVSGHPEKARQLAEVFHVEPGSLYDYATFAEIAENPKVDVVYIVLPNSMHADFTIRALQAGKHVLCEKPMASTIDECERMITAAEQAGRKLGVAYRLHYEPFTQAVIEMCRKDKLGTIKTFTSSNCQNVEAPNIRLSAPLGGGPVGDLGVYCINAARYTINEEPIEAIAIQAQPKADPRFREVPESVSFLLRYPSGVLAACECSFGTERASSFRALGPLGSVTMDPAFSYRGQRLRVETTEKQTPRQTEIRVEAVDHFAAEMDGFSEAVIRDQPVPTPGEMGLADMRIVLAVMESARRNGEPVKIGEPAV